MTKSDDGFDPRWDGAKIPKHHWHFHRQLLARYGFVLGPGDFSHILRDIRTGRALLVEQRDSGRAIYFVKVRSLFERIYVLSNGRHLITAWPATKELVDKRRRIDP